MSALAVPRRRVLVVVPLLLVALFAWWAGHAGSEALPSPARADAAQAGRISFANLPGAVQATLPVRSFSAGGTNASTGGTGGGGAGKFVPDDLSVVVDADDVDPLLLRTVTTGVHVATVTVTLFRPGTTKRQEVWQLADATISALHSAQSGSSRAPRVTLGLRYTRVTVTSYTGSGDVAGSYCFDLAGNTTCPAA